MENLNIRAPISRRKSLCVLAAGLFGSQFVPTRSQASTTEVSWLEQVVRGPRVVPAAGRGSFEPLLTDSAGQPITTLDQWKQKRQEIRKAWYEFLGPMPQDRPPVTLTVLREDRDAVCRRQLVEYESEPGEKVEGFLLSPLDDSSKKRPAVVALHQTTNDTIDEIAGVKGPEAQHLGLKLCRRGFVVFCPRNFLWKHKKPDDYQAEVARFKQQHPETLGMHKMLYDAMRGVDVLASLPNVDANRIGCAGHSLGGKESLYLAAFDIRVRAAVASELGIGFTYTNWHAPWYLGTAIQQPDFKLNHHQLVALIAPRPFLLLAGESGSRGVADGDRSWPYLEAAHPICRLYGEPVRIGMYNHGQGHSVPPNAFEKIAEWLEMYLS